MKCARLFAAMAATLAAVSTNVAAQPAKHVIIISIDGLHQADLTDPALKQFIPNLLNLAGSGVWYTNASGTIPSDSFPGTMAYLTGAGPGTTGIYYDEAYSRAFLAPGASALGSPMNNTEDLDKNNELLTGGGDSGKGSLDVTKFPTDPAHGNSPVFPHDCLKVNTIFEVAHAAGLRTSMIDKHPAYEIAAGPSGAGVDDLYCPEIEAKTALQDEKLVDSSNAAPDTKLKVITKHVPLADAYDTMKLAALLNELHGQDARGSASAAVPGLVVVNLQALNVSEKSNTGGIRMQGNVEVPTPELVDAISHDDAAVGQIVKEVKSAGLWDQTLIVLLAKHGQDPRVGVATMISPSVVLNPLKAAGIAVARSTMDDVALIWLADPTQGAQATKALQGIATTAGIDQILSGDSLAAAKLTGHPDRSPDIVISLKTGFIFTDKPKRAEHGGFCEDDTHVPVILTGGVVAEKTRGSMVSAPVKTTQVAVTALDALELDASLLQGAKIENTQPLPDSGLETAVAAAAKMQN